MNYFTQTEIQRRNIAMKQINFYNYQQEYYTNLLLKKTFKQNDMTMWAISSPITEKIINDISLLFQQKPIITIKSVKSVSDKLQDLLQQSNFYSMLVLLNRYVNLVGKVGVLTRIFEQQLIFDLITPDSCVVIPEQKFPTIVKELLYYNGVVNNTNYIQLTQKWIRFTKQTISTVQIDQTGKITKEYNVEQNPYGYIPVIWFSNTYDVDNFFKLTINPIVKYNEYYNVAKSYQNLALAYQATATMVSIGMDKQFKIQFGPQNFINIPVDSATYNQNGQQYDIKYINPNTNFDALYKYSQDIENQLASYAGINAQSYRNATNYSSGWHFELSRQDIINQNIMQKPFYNSGLKKLIKCICDTINIYSNLYQMPQNVITQIDFAELSVKSNPLEQWQIWQKELQYNIKTIKDILKESNKDLTEKDIEKIIQDNKTYNQNNKSNIQIINKVVDNQNISDNNNN